MTESPLKSASKSPTVQSSQITTNAKTKKRGTFSLFKAALFVMRPTSQKDDINKKKSVQLPTDHPDQVGNWTKLVGSMRPLHLQENLNSPPSSPLPDSSSVENLVDLVPRVSSFSSISSPSTTTMSQYASASNLQELDRDEDDSETEEDPDEVFDAITGDDMIDSKADQFIAQFYKQIKIQNNVGFTFDGY